MWSLIFNSTALKLREKMWSLDAAFDPQISPSFFIFLHPPHLFKALQGRPLDEVVGVHRLPPANVDRNGQKIQWIIYIYEWYVNIMNSDDFRIVQIHSDINMLLTLVTKKWNWNGSIVKLRHAPAQLHPARTWPHTEQPLECNAKDAWMKTEKKNERLGVLRGKTTGIYWQTGHSFTQTYHIWFIWFGLLCNLSWPSLFHLFPPRPGPQATQTQNAQNAQNALNL